MTAAMDDFLAALVLFLCTDTAMWVHVQLLVGNRAGRMKRHIVSPAFRPGNFFPRAGSIAAFSAAFSLLKSQGFADWYVGLTVTIVLFVIAVSVSAALLWRQVKRQLRPAREP
jgi:hypothetical protein